MIKSKAWNWEVAKASLWEEPAPEVFHLIKRWLKLGYKHILDLGCGIGRHSLLFAQNNFSVDALDLSKNGIDKLNKLITKENLQNVRPQVGDMLSLPYKDNAFDCLLAYHAIYHTDDSGLIKVINEIRRVLKKDGEAFITFNSINSSDYKNPENKQLSKNTIVKTKGREVGIPHYYANKADVERILKDFSIEEFSYKEYYSGDYTGAHYFVLVKKV